MLCILQCKRAIDDNIAGNEEDLTNHDDTDIHILPIISDPENSFYLNCSFSCPAYYNPFVKSGKTATNADIHTNVINIK